MLGSERGTSPPHWYFTSALPRSLLLAFPLAFLVGRCRLKPRETRVESTLLS